MCSGNHFSFTICVYVLLVHIRYLLLVYIAVAWEKKDEIFSKAISHFSISYYNS